LTMSRPAGLRAIADKDLMDHGYLVDQKLNGEAPTLGLAFTLKLIRGIVQHLGGTFAMTPQSFKLILPAMPATGSGQESKA